MLSRKAYRLVLKHLENLKQSHLQDRKENPHLAPCSYNIGHFESIIKAACRESRSAYHEGLVYETLNYLCKKGLLMGWCGGYTFPEDNLPTEEEVKKQTLEHVKRLFQRPQSM